MASGVGVDVTSGRRGGGSAYAVAPPPLAIAATSNMPASPPRWIMVVWVFMTLLPLLSYLIALFESRWNRPPLRSPWRLRMGTNVGTGVGSGVETDRRASCSDFLH